MKLFYVPGACSLSPHIALLEAGAQFTAEKVDMKTKTTASGADFTSINTKGYVPALELDDGELLTEGAAIVQYIADQNPASGLAPAAGTLARYKLQEWLNFIATEVHKPLGSMFNPNQSADWKAAVTANLSKRLTWLEPQLADGFLMGEGFTVADGYLFTALGWAGHVGFDLSPWPAVQAYLGRVAARPAVQAALKAEGLI